MRYLSPSTSVCTERMSVNGGSTATSTASRSLSVSENASFCTRAMASRWLRFIFQLPAISGVRAMVTSSSAVRAGQLLALEELEAGAAPGGDVAERLLVEAELAHRGGRVAAADDGEAVGCVTSVMAWATARVPSANGAISKTPIGPFQNTVRASASFAANSAPLSRADVEAQPVGRDGVDGDDVVVGVGRELGRRDDVDRQHDLDALGLGLLEVAADGVELVLLEQALADLVALGLEEGEDHAAADEQPVDRRRAGCR